MFRAVPTLHHPRRCWDTPGPIAHAISTTPTPDSGGRGSPDRCPHQSPRTAWVSTLQTDALMAVGRGRVVEDVDLRFGGNDFTYKKLFHLLIEIVS